METGSYYLRARYYAPRLGRFTQADPARDGLNYYTYCANNPLRFIDPTGLAYEIADGKRETKKDRNPQTTSSSNTTQQALSGPPGIHRRLMLEIPSLNPSGNVTRTPGEAVTPFYTNGIAFRRADLYNQVIDQFDVKNNPRYTPRYSDEGELLTYCNILAWDVTSAMGAEIPYELRDEKGIVYQYQNVPRMNTWLSGSEGRAAGWRPATEAEAIANANEGKPTVSLHPTKHIQVVRPQQNGDTGVMVAQAGKTSVISNYDAMGNAYGNIGLEKIVYYVHD